MADYYSQILAVVEGIYLLVDHFVDLDFESPILEETFVLATIAFEMTSFLTTVAYSLSYTIKFRTICPLQNGFCRYNCLYQNRIMSSMNRFGLGMVWYYFLV